MASPRVRSRCSTPARLSATRLPGPIAPTGSPSVWIWRTRTSCPPGATTRRSPVATAPSVNVPVTTVPLPLAANTRSIHSRARPRSTAAGVVRASSPSAAARASTPLPVGVATGTIGAPARNVPATRSATSSAASSTSSGSSSTSTFVRATTPWRTPTSSRIRRCSSLCGFHPSVAATTNRQASTPPTPASMLRRNRTWPGTSTKLTGSPSSTAWAKPRSIVRPRRCSSAKRSGSVPVSASTSDDLPWST